MKLVQLGTKIVHVSQRGCDLGQRARGIRCELADAA
jgi:hypothetical protein